MTSKHQPMTQTDAFAPEPRMTAPLPAALQSGEPEQCVMLIDPVALQWLNERMAFLNYDMLMERRRVVAMGASNPQRGTHIESIDRDLLILGRVMHATNAARAFKSVITTPCGSMLLRRQAG